MTASFWFATTVLSALFLCMPVLGGPALSRSLPLGQKDLANDLFSRDTADELTDVVVVYNKHKDHSQNLSKRTEHIDLIESLVAENDGSGIKGHFTVGRSTAGYHGRFTQRMIKIIRDSPEIATVEPDSIERIQGAFIYEQRNASWGLSRISHLDNTYGTDEEKQYLFEDSAGKNTTIYVLDTGVRLSHREFAGRARWGANFANDMDEDENGHGTHVAGIAAGSDVGVAKYANVVAVKILDKNQTGTLSNFLKGMSWIIDDVKKHPETKAIINYSAVGEISDARDQALQEVLDAGILFIGAAGNSDTDACTVGPPNDRKVGQITVGALNYTDEPAAFTNYGECVQVSAPGVEIRSSINDGDDAYGIMSGSSMAAPHVAGLGAYFWSLNSSLSLADISSKIIDGNGGRITADLRGTANKIAYNHVH